MCIRFEAERVCCVGSGPVPAESSSDVLVVRAEGPQGRRRNLLEVYGRQWAAEQGVPVPRVIDHDPDGAWLVGERIHPGLPAGSEYLELAFEAARRIEEGAEPHPPLAPTTWRNPNRRRTVMRAAKLARGGVSPSVFIRARKAAAELPREVPSHCDFHIGNVLLPGPSSPHSGDAAVVIDFEYLCMGPRYADVIRLITTLVSHDDAVDAFEMLAQRSSRAEWHSIAIQLRWLGLRPLAELLATTQRSDHSKIVHARERWILARQWATEIEGS